MMRPAAILLGLLAAGCAGTPPIPAQYDFDSISTLGAPDARLQATIAIPPISSPSWLRTPALVYRLAYARPPVLKPYSLTRWAAPPAELLTLRLRQAVSAANSGFTLTHRGIGTQGYRLEVTLERFVQVFSSPRASRCFVTLSATLTNRGNRERVLAQRTFRGEQAAPSSDAAGAVRGLVGASDACIDQIVLWLHAVLQSHPVGVIGP